MNYRNALHDVFTKYGFQEEDAKLKLNHLMLMEELAVKTAKPDWTSVRLGNYKDWWDAPELTTPVYMDSDGIQTRSKTRARYNIQPWRTIEGDDTPSCWIDSQDLDFYKVIWKNMFRLTHDNPTKMEHKNWFNLVNWSRIYPLFRDLNIHRTYYDESLVLAWRIDTLDEKCIPTKYKRKLIDPNP